MWRFDSPHATRLAALRRFLSSLALDGFVIPRSDEHQGEYVPAHAERLKWLTGFSGSAGMALVMQSRAALFFDGRYVIQAAQQVDGDLFDLCHLADKKPSDWLNEQLREGMTLAFDPWLQSEKQLQPLQKLLQAKGCRLQALNDNPIDGLWDDRPLPPLAPVVPYPLKYAGERAEDKIKRLAGQLRDKGQDAVVLTLPDSIAWLLNVRGGDVPSTPLPLSFALLKGNEEVEWFIHPQKLSDEVKKALPGRVILFTPQAFETRLEALQGKGVVLDPQTAPFKVLSILEEADAKVERGLEPCQRAKAQKNETELAGIRAAHLRDGLAMLRFLKWLEEEAIPRAPGDHPVTEIEAEQKLLSFRQAQELFQEVSFETISASGGNAAICHYKATGQNNRNLRAGEAYLLDSGGQYLDGTTDITRTFWLGPLEAGPLGSEFKQRFTLVLKGLIALSQAQFPEGTTGGHLDCLARQFLWQSGLDFDHGTGHGVGAYLGVHEGPQRIAKMASSAPLEKGMVLSNEPGYYKEGAYGIRIENLIAVKALEERKDQNRPFFAFETLTLVPIETSLIDAGLLTRGEKIWLNAYHQQVYEKLSAFLSPEEKAFLALKTQAIS